jgi:hypothetical protein
MKTKKQNPYTWCKGLYLSAGVYKENYTLRKDTEVEFISGAIVKLKGLPITIKREILTDSDIKDNEHSLDKRIDFMVPKWQFEYLKEKARKTGRSISDTLRFMIRVSDMDDYSGTEESKKDSKYIEK